ncbi:Protein of unknown function [Rhizobiales bacterium GAS191]|nr:Protein of unknown function [Rhizobiales bacterium GAS191]
MTDQPETRAELSIVSEIPIVSPRAEFVYEAICEIGPVIPLGGSPLGDRRLVPILGGSFVGPAIRGSIIPGGADRQLVRKDGVTLLDALYEMQTADGAILTVNNKVLIDPGNGPAGYRFSTIAITAPDGPHAWLNRLILVGTLTSLRPRREAVLIRAFKLV